MKPRQFEELVCEHFRQQGYETEITPYTNDYGVDAFVTKGKEKIAIQAKMYGPARKVNRKMVMELHGAKDFFDCTKAVIVTNGTFLQDALTVAEKLEIGIMYFYEFQASIPKPQTLTNNKSGNIFEQIWENYIIPVQGQTLIRSNGKTNKILKVDWSGVERLTSNGNKGKIEIEIFKQAVNKLMTEGTITRDYINQNYVGRASSGVVLILSQVRFFRLTERPKGLKYER